MLEPSTWWRVIRKSVPRLGSVLGICLFALGLAFCAKSPEAATSLTEIPIENQLLLETIRSGPVSVKVTDTGGTPDEVSAVGSGAADLETGAAYVILELQIAGSNGGGSPTQDGAQGVIELLFQDDDLLLRSAPLSGTFWIRQPLKTGNGEPEIDEANDLPYLVFSPVGALGLVALTPEQPESGEGGSEGDSGSFTEEARLREATLEGVPFSLSALQLGLWQAGINSASVSVGSAEGRISSLSFGVMLPNQRQMHTYEFLFSDYGRPIDIPRPKSEEIRAPEDLSGGESGPKTGREELEPLEPSPQG